MIIANSYSLSGDLYQFNFDDGVRLYPSSSIVLVRDESDYISVKTVGSYETILLVKA